jgi:hypothetical protein
VSLVIFSSLLWMAHPASSLQIYPGNGHAYDVITTTISWTSARDQAEQLTPPPGFKAGHLVTYSDAAEEAFGSPPSEAT